MEYVGKRARRLLPTYFFWSVIFVLATAAFDLFYDGGCLNPRYETASFWWAVMFRGGSSAQLWFLICLFYAQVALMGLFKVCASRWFGVVWIVLGGMIISVCEGNPEWRERVVKVASVLGATSLGVYLVHPLVTRGLWAVVARMFQPPFSAWIVLGEWVLAWAVALVVAAVLGRVPGVRRMV